MFWPNTGVSDIIKKREGIIFRKVLNSNKGYSLTEIVLVLAFLGIIISGVFPVFINSIEANKSADYYSKAYKLLDSKMEEYRNTSFEALSSGQFPIAELPSGQGTLTVSDNVDGAPQTDIKEVELKINWYFRRTREVKISTYIARGGIKK